MDKAFWKAFTEIFVVERRLAKGALVHPALLDSVRVRFGAQSRTGGDFISAVRPRRRQK